MGLFDKLNKQSGNAAIRRQTRQSLMWFKQRVSAITKVNRKKILEDEALKLTKRPLIGRMFMFFYDPKHKAVLPFYDRFPLVIMIDKAPGGFYGLNLHYLNPNLRAKFFDNLLSFANNDKYDDTTKIKLSYELLSKSSKLGPFKPCFKHYLTSHIKSSIAEVPSSEWEIAVFLPTEQFKGSDKYKVWNDSENKI